QNLALERQNRLKLTVTALLRRPACRVTLDEEQLRLGGILFLAIRELAGQAHVVEDALAPGHLTRLARGFTRGGRLDDLPADDLGFNRPLQQELGELFCHDFFDRWPRL